MLIVTTTARREEFAFQAYQDGCDVTEAEFTETLEAKDAFINEQAKLLQVLAATPALNWRELPDDIQNQLADYV